MHLWHNCWESTRLTLCLLFSSQKKRNLLLFQSSSVMRLLKRRNGCTQRWWKRRPPCSSALYRGLRPLNNPCSIRGLSLRLPCHSSICPRRYIRISSRYALQFLLAVTRIQRFGSVHNLNLNLHFHLLHICCTSAACDRKGYCWQWNHRTQRSLIRFPISSPTGSSILGAGRVFVSGCGVRIPRPDA